jgi:general secretion pathway protein A
VKVAGRQAPLFSYRAIARIADATRGIPRSINVLCDMVLVYAFASGQTEIKVAVVDEVLKDKAEFGMIALPGQTAPTN